MDRVRDRKQKNPSSVLPKHEKGLRGRGFNTISRESKEEEERGISTYGAPVAERGTNLSSTCALFALSAMSGPWVPEQMEYDRCFF